MKKYNSAIMIVLIIFALILVTVIISKNEGLIIKTHLHKYERFNASSDVNVQKDKNCIDIEIWIENNMSVEIAQDIVNFMNQFISERKSKEVKVEINIINGPGRIVLSNYWGDKKYDDFLVAEFKIGGQYVVDYLMTFDELKVLYFEDVSFWDKNNIYLNSPEVIILPGLDIQQEKLVYVFLKNKFPYCDVHSIIDEKYCNICNEAGVDYQDFADRLSQINLDKYKCSHIYMHDKYGDIEFRFERKNIYSELNSFEQLSDMMKVRKFIIQYLEENRDDILNLKPIRIVLAQSDDSGVIYVSNYKYLGEFEMDKVTDFSYYSVTVSDGNSLDLIENPKIIYLNVGDIDDFDTIRSWNNIHE